jgi:hypothetical protein
MLSLTPLLLQLLELGIQVAPSVIAAAQQEVALFNSSTMPDAAQQTQINAALDEANAALQAAQPGT